MTWISIDITLAVIGCSRRRLPQKISSERIVTREVGRGRNGKPVREILLESLEPKYQERYFALTRSETATGEAAVSAPDICAEIRESGAKTPPVERATHVQQLTSLSENQLQQANRLAEALQAVRESAHKTAAKVAIARAYGKTVRWVEMQLRRQNDLGVTGLARKKRSDRGVSRVADRAVVAQIQAAYLKPYRPTVADVYRSISKEYEMSGCPAPSYDSVRREIGRLPPDILARERIGEKYFDDKFSLITLRRKPDLPRQWCDSDHHQLDHIVIFPDNSIGRPWITAIQDICTNEILGYVLTKEKRSSYPGSAGIGLTLRIAILKKDDPQWPSFGIFENFYHDLGRDFRGQYVRGVCHDLHINVRPARGYHGKSKPIERWFGLLEAGLKHLPGYIGGSTDTNPLHQNVGPSTAWEQLRGEIMTVDQFEAALHKWIVAEFHHTESRALRGLSPIGALEKHIKNGWTPREVASERALDLLLMHRKSKKVHRYGIEMFGSRGAQRFFMAPELAGLVGQEVEVFYDPANIGELVIYKETRFLCKAQNRELLDYGASEEDLKREREIKALQRKALQERIDELTQQAQHPNALARATAEKLRDKVMDEEREKLAANATGRSVAQMLPAKFHEAQKKLPNAPVAKRERARPTVADDLPAAEELFSKNDNLYADEEPQDTAALFQRELNPWLTEDDE